MEPGFRWLKNPAASAPGWLENPERLAALALRTVVGFLVSSVIQRQGRRYLRTPEPPLPGTTGLTAIPTAAGLLAVLSQGALVP